MFKPTIALTVLLTLPLIGGCTKEPDRQAQEAARAKMHKTTAEPRSNYQQ